MTAEIVIMNKDAVAVAADSAVTLTLGKNSEKVFTSAHKIFTLSKYYPVGIMIYNNAHFMSIPWETIIKIYRNKLGEKSFDKLEDYADNFINFLKNEFYSFTEQSERIYVENLIYNYYSLLRKDIESELRHFLDKEERITEELIDSLGARIASKIIGAHYSIWKESEFIPSVPNDQGRYLKNNYSKLIEILKIESFEAININEEDWVKLTAIATFLVTRFPERLFDPFNDFFHSITSGIVIMGFGKEDIFPSLKSFLVNGIMNNHLMYREDRHVKVDFDNRSFIIPFAQCEMVHSFMQGVIPTYQYFITEKLHRHIQQFREDFANENNKLDEEKMLMKSKLKMYTDNLIETYFDELYEGRVRYANQVTKVVSHLPKTELALMAKTLVNLTSFKRKVSMQSETVSDPIDVAIISKGDGFIWIERKQYFKPEFNPQFLENYNRGES